MHSLKEVKCGSIEDIGNYAMKELESDLFLFVTPNVKKTDPLIKVVPC